MKVRSGLVASTCWSATVVLSCFIAGCGGGGPASPPPAHPSSLFVVDASTAAVAGFDSTTPPAGSTAAGHNLALLSNTDGPVAYDPVHDLLYVATTPPHTSNDSSAQIRVFEHARTLGAGAMPARSISLENSQQIQGMAVDGASDTLWVFERDMIYTTVDDAIIRRVGSASTATSSPDFVVTLGHWTESATYDPVRDIVYASDGSGIRVLSQASASKYWIAAPTQEFGTGIDGVALACDTARDIVYVADGAGGGIGLMLNASTASPTFVGLRLLPAPPTSLAVDSANDRLYVSAGGSVYVFDQASRLTTQSPVPAPTIVGAASDRYWLAGATIR